MWHGSSDRNLIDLAGLAAASRRGIAEFSQAAEASEAAGARKNERPRDSALKALRVTRRIAAYEACNSRERHRGNAGQ
jgi:hypothetical protein